MKPNTDSIIDDLVTITMNGRTTREQFLFRQSLHNLVRLAKAEQMLEIRTSVARLAGGMPVSGAGNKAEVDDESAFPVSSPHSVTDTAQFRKL